MTMTQSQPGVDHGRPAAADQLDEVPDDDGRRPRTARPRLIGGAIAAVAAAAILFVAVKPGDDLAGSEAAEVIPATEPTTTVAPVPTTEAPTTTVPRADAPATAAPAAVTPVAATDLPDFPDEFEIFHGSTPWALYLEVASDAESPALAAAGQAVIDAGYSDAYYGGGQLGCDQGAAEYLGYSSDIYTVATYFETQAEALQARAAFEARDVQVIGIVHVKTYCLD